LGSFLKLGFGNQQLQPVRFIEKFFCSLSVGLSSEAGITTLDCVAVTEGVWMLGVAIEMKLLQ
jgi:hypothetical protein